MLDIAQFDPSPSIRHYVAKALLVALGLMIRGNNAESSSVEEFAEEEGRVIIEDAWRKRPNGLVEFHKAVLDIRAIFATNMELQHYLWNALNNKAATRLDHRVLKYILQFCEYAYKPVDVGLKVTIRVPTLPAASFSEEPEGTPTSSRATASPVVETPKISIPVATPAATVIQTATPSSTVTVTKPSKPKEPKPPKLPKPVSVTSSAEGITLEDLRKAKRILNKLLKHKASFWFRQAVDPIRDGAPDYFKYVKTPMDLGTVQTKLDSAQYRTLKEFENDIRLVFSNCYVFNPRGTEVYNEGQALEALYEKEWAKISGQAQGADVNMTIIESPAQTPTEVAPPVSKPSSKPIVTKPATVPSPSTVTPPKITTTVKANVVPPAATPPASFTPTPSPIANAKPVTVPRPPAPKVTNGVVKTEKTDMEKCQAILQKILQNKLSAEFRQPVDPELQGIPHYRQIITNPMDFGTVKTKLKKGKYTTPKEFDHDMRLVFRNCYTFNPPDNPVFQQCKLLEKEYSKLWQSQFGSQSASESPVPAAGAFSPSVSSAPKITISQVPRPHAASVPPKPAMSPVVKQQPRQASVGADNVSVLSNSNKPAASAPLDMTMNPLNYSKCERILQKLTDSPAALPFLQPVS